MIGLIFELLEWTIKLTIVVLVIAIRMTAWLAKLLFIGVAATVAFIATERSRRNLKRAV